METEEKRALQRELRIVPLEEDPLTTETEAWEKERRSKNFWDIAQWLMLGGLVVLLGMVMWVLLT